ncbi:peptide ABC transporter permease [Corynebacterium sp. HMSC22B11]|uniref:ABC transporter permease n=1 Tax=Corynebacterium sp. HMSC22B11 TaxID=1581056 RepID=UPI0008A55816|nr:ABC transporter permease [Corynebacterium sp. HMSC22B11]OFO11458.1 peptide ABC transporter permease [Corynebacterium sp. HMSC22B11]
MTTTLTSKSPLRSRLTGRSRPRPRKAGWGAVVSGLIVVIALAWALVPGLFASGDPVNSGSTAPLLPPSTEHWFGTDAVGRDLYTRVVWGTRQSLLGALVAVLLGMIIGTLLGVIAGSSRARRGSSTGAKGSWVDTLIMRIVDVLLAIPALLLSLSVIIVLGYGSINAAIAVGITNVAMFARLARSEVLGVASSDYVEAAYASGGTRASVLWRHVLPNSLTPVLALAALQFGSAILQLSALSFLGYGAPPPTPEWGLIIAEGRDFIATSWWLTVLPGLAIVLVVLATNHLSTVLRDREGARS